MEAVRRGGESRREGYCSYDIPKSRGWVTTAAIEAALPPNQKGYRTAGDLGFFLGVGSTLLLTTGEAVVDMAPLAGGCREQEMRRDKRKGREGTGIKSVACFGQKLSEEKNEKTA